MARRKNADFTLDQTYGSGHGDRSLIQAFYEQLDELYPGKIALPIPPAAKVHPQGDLLHQGAVCLDCAVRKISPLLLKALGCRASAKQMANMPPITVQTTPEELQALIDFVFDTFNHAVMQAADEDTRTTDAAEARTKDTTLSRAEWKVAVDVWRKMLKNGSQQADLRRIFTRLTSSISSYSSTKVYTYSPFKPTFLATYVAELVAAVAGGGKPSLSFTDELHPPLYTKETWAAVNEMLQAL